MLARCDLVCVKCTCLIRATNTQLGIGCRYLHYSPVQGALEEQDVAVLAGVAIQRKMLLSLLQLPPALLK